VTDSDGETRRQVTAAKSIAPSCIPVSCTHNRPTDRTDRTSAFLHLAPTSHLYLIVIVIVIVIASQSTWRVKMAPRAIRITRKCQNSIKDTGSRQSVSSGQNVLVQVWQMTVSRAESSWPSWLAIDFLVLFWGFLSRFGRL
jgi:hypothetical protein